MLPDKPWKSESLAWLLLSLFVALALVGFGVSLADRWLAAELMLSVADLKDAAALAAKLRQPTDGVSSYIKSRLSEESMEGLENLGAQLTGESSSTRLAELLVRDLNKIIAGPLVYEAERFSDATLEEETKRLLDARPARNDLRRLNRRLLQDAYPAELLPYELSETAAQARQMWLQVGFTPLFQVMTLVLVGRFLRKNQMTWIEAFGLTTRRLGHHLMLAVGAIVAIFPVCLGLIWVSQRLMEWRSVAPEMQTMVKVLQTARGWDQYGLLGVTAILLAPVWEEIVFRGILFTSIRQAGFPRLAWIGTCLLFSGSHMNLVTFLPLFAFGLLMIWLYKRTENLLAPVVAHALFNATNFAWMILGGSTAGDP